MASVRAGTVVTGLLSAIVPLFLALLGAVWYLASRFSYQDGLFREIKMRLNRIDKALGLSMWDNDDDG